MIGIALVPLIEKARRRELARLRVRIPEESRVMILVFGYQAVGHACLETLLDLGETDLHLMTHRDRPGENIWWPSAADLARSAGLAVTFAEDYDRAELTRFVRTLSPRLIYSFYYRDLIPMRALRVAELGAYNLHGSMLPEFRGRCPVNWAVLKRAERTGVTLHHMLARADAGDIVGQLPLAIGPRDTALDVFNAMIPLAAKLLTECHPMIMDGAAPRTPQDERRATTFGGRRPEDGAIDWSQDHRDVDALVRAVTHPYPGAFGRLDDRKLFVWKSSPASVCSDGEPGTVLEVVDDSVRVACGTGCLDIHELSIEGQAEIVAARAFDQLAGRRLRSGMSS